MKRILFAAAITALASTAMVSATNAETIKLGVILGYTGPIESLTPDMAAGAELAIKEVSKSGALLGGAKVVAVRGDTTCTDSAAATAATLTKFPLPLLKVSAASSLVDCAPGTV